MQSKYHKAIHWFIIHNLILIVLGSSFLIYLAFFDGGKPLTVYDQPMQTVEDVLDENGNFIPKHVFRTGETLNYAFNYCKTRNVPGEMYGSYIDTIKMDMPVVKIKSPVGCGSRISSLYLIPKILPSGKYYFEVEVIYQVNPIREVRVRYRTEDFQIINTSLKSI